MNHGCVNGELFKYDDRAKARAYIASLDTTKAVKEAFFKYWLSIQQQKQNAAFRYERQQAEKLRKAKLKTRG